MTGNKVKYKISTAKLRMAVRGLALELPEAQYTDEHGKVGGGCSYVRGKCSVDGVPGCIVGRALQKFGVSTETLAAMDNTCSIYHLLCGRAELSKSIRAEIFDDINKDDITWLSLVQVYQDDGMTWWKAVLAADEKVSENIKTRLANAQKV